MSELLKSLLQSLWQLNIEISLLLVAVWVARYAIRKSTKIYNAYLLWMSIPIGLVIANLVNQIRFTEPLAPTVSYIVQDYIVQPKASLDNWLILAYLWGGVAAILLMRLLQQHRSLRRELKHISVSDIPELSAGYPLIGIDKEDFSPAVYGFIKPTIYFPVQLLEQLSDQQIKLIIQHEEHHIKQKHLWLNLLWDVVVCCMWFNPLVYLSRQNFRHDQELYCDYLVLNGSNNQDHKSYGHALLSTVSATHSVSLLCSWKSIDQLEERIMNLKRPTSFSGKVSIGISAIAIIAATSLYTVSAAQKLNQESFRHHISDDGQNQVEWRKNNTTYINNNGELHVVENNTARSMSEPERLDLEQKIEQSKREWNTNDTQLAIAQNQEKARRAERRAERNSERKRANLERQQEQAQRNLQRQAANEARAKARHEKQQAKQFSRQQQQREIEAAHLEMQAHQQEFVQHQNEYQIHLHSKAIEDARCKLDKAQKKLAKERSRTNMSVQTVNQAKRELAKAKRELNQQRKKKGRSHLDSELALNNIAPLAPLPPLEPLPSLEPFAPLPPLAPIAPEPPQSKSKSDKGYSRRMESFDTSVPH